MTDLRDLIPADTPAYMYDAWASCADRAFVEQFVGWANANVWGRLDSDEPGRVKA